MIKKLKDDERGSILLEFSICGIMFLGIVFGMFVFSIYMYNVANVKQAARIGAHEMAVSSNGSEAVKLANDYLDRTLIACPKKNVVAYGKYDKGYGSVDVEMYSMFPYFNVMLNPKGKKLEDNIKISKEAYLVREQRFR